MRPRSDFYARHDPETGRIYALALCKEHDKARAHAWQKANRSRYHKSQKRIREAVKRDPERLAIQRDQNRESRRRLGHISADRFRVTTVGSRRVVEELPPKPFAEWLDQVMERDGVTIVALAGRFGVSERTLRAARKGRPVELTTVERCLLADDVVTLRELYPDLYEVVA